MIDNEEDNFQFGPNLLTGIITQGLGFNALAQTAQTDNLLSRLTNTSVRMYIK